MAPENYSEGAFQRLYLIQHLQSNMIPAVKRGTDVIIPHVKECKFCAAGEYGSTVRQGQQRKEQSVSIFKRGQTDFTKYCFEA